MEGKEVEHRITVNLERLSEYVNILLICLLFLSLVLNFLYPNSLLLYFSSFFIFLVNGINFYYRHIQKKHALLTNFGILAQFRYVIESLGPEFRQYLYSSDTEGRPFNRAERADVYRKSKGVENSAAFGSLLNFDVKELKLKHSFFPKAPIEVKPFKLVFGEERNLKNAYTIHSPLMIGGMSYGSLGSQAVRALSRGALKASIPINTGEGGYPKYHLMEGSHLIFQMGTAKFGVRTPEGLLDEKKLKELSQNPLVKMIEIKFSQGAKPGKGGLLPREKLTPEIARLRGVEIGKDVLSPASHIEIKDAHSTCLFIKKIQDISELPVGIKFCLGRENDFYGLVREMKNLNIFPDFISIDGAEGGTGAAPKVFMDHIGTPLFEALPKVHKILKDEGVRDRTKIVASGKLINSGRQMMALCFGADAFYTARGFMLALGCVQALRCNNNTCPVGITTHSNKLQKGLDIEDKSTRIKNYVQNLNHDYVEILSALGLQSFRELNSELILIS